ncbi:two-component system sensor histidine kinase NtrB [Sphingomonas aracearum]|uniref:histidine kinase n=1 Tax=Sphingomonas aracearum TaxID=2283317 RepID=A0A369VVQ5_9SPHN|nr:ATP-binding protein [Sphingomonas aracearum]RDE06173.1 two-component sensor histidine kinase [Sphingomonas aracearum]
MEDAASDARFGEIFANLPIAALAIDPAGCVAHANGEAEALLNLSERAMLHQPLTGILVPPQGRQQRDGHGFAAYDSEVVLARGGRLRLDWLESALPDRPGWCVVLLHPVGASRRMGHSADRASGARAAVGAAAMLAHEIKNPLSGIRGAAQLIGSGMGEGTAELTQLITTEVDRIAALIDRMQDFTDTRPLAVESVNVYPLLDHARRLALAGFAAGIAIEERFDPSLPPAALNSDALLQILLNLLKNAAEAVAVQADPRITVTTAFRHGMAVSAAPGRPRLPLPIELCVIDNGPGPPPEIAEHLFDPFVSGKPEGQGLGLALTDKLVRGMGGLVQFSREGVPEATVFRILLPRGDA